MNMNIRDERQLSALTGLTQAQFDQLLPIFSAVYQAQRQASYEQAVQTGQRQRKPGGDRQSKLATPAAKLLFVLYYYKTYPTFDVLGTHFNLARSKAHRQLYQLSPILHETLVQLAMMPRRAFQTVADLTLALKGIDQIIMDATEHAYRRPQAAEQQRAHYSGKKTAYAQEHCDHGTTKVIVFLGHTFPGHSHDYTMLKAELPPDLDWFADLLVRVDLGYLGIQTDYVGERIERPHKKPRKSKQQPETCLTPVQKAENKALSQVRIAIEHAIGGMKRYNILVHRFRNHRENFHDHVIAICAALWNFSLAY